MINTAFHEGAKRPKKQGEENYYAKYGMERGGRGEKINMIRKIDIMFAYYIIEGKNMRHFTGMKV